MGWCVGVGGGGGVEAALELFPLKPFYRAAAGKNSNALGYETSGWRRAEQLRIALANTVSAVSPD